MEICNDVLESINSIDNSIKIGGLIKSKEKSINCNLLDSTKKYNIVGIWQRDINENIYILMFSPFRENTTMLLEQYILCFDPSYIEFDIYELNPETIGSEDFILKNIFIEDIIREECKKEYIYRLLIRSNLDIFMDVFLNTFLDFHTIYYINTSSTYEPRAIIKDVEFMIQSIENKYIEEEDISYDISLKIKRETRFFLSKIECEKNINFVVKQNLDNFINVFNFNIDILDKKISLVLLKEQNTITILECYILLNLCCNNIIKFKSLKIYREIEKIFYSYFNIFSDKLFYPIPIDVLRDYKKLTPNNYHDYRRVFVKERIWYKKNNTINPATDFEKSENISTDMNDFSINLDELKLHDSSPVDGGDLYINILFNLVLPFDTIDIYPDRSLKIIYNFINDLDKILYNNADIPFYLEYIQDIYNFGYTNSHILLYNISSKLLLYFKEENNVEIYDILDRLEYIKLVCSRFINSMYIPYDNSFRDSIKITYELDQDFNYQNVKYFYVCSYDVNFNIQNNDTGENKELYSLNFAYNIFNYINPLHLDIIIEKNYKTIDVWVNLTEKILNNKILDRNIIKNCIISYKLIKKHYRNSGCDHKINKINKIMRKIEEL